MKKLINSSFFILVAFVIFVLVGCNETNRLGMEKIIAVEEHHATRVFIIYKDKNGSYYNATIHQSNTVTDGITTINPHDYLSLYGGKRPYGPIPGCEKEYQNYVTNKHTP